MGPELGRLDDGALRQLTAGHPGGEAEIVLDPHAAAGLPTGPGLLQHHRAEPLRGGIDRAGQPGWPGPHHDQIMDGLLQRLTDAERHCELVVRGVAQKQLAAPGDHGCFRFAHPEPLEQVVHLGVGLQIQPRERDSVLGQKLADPQRIPRIAGADNAQPREVRRLAQELPSGDERLQDDGLRRLRNGSGPRR